MSEDEEKTLDPAEVEKKLIEAAEARANDIEGMAWTTYNMLKPRYMSGIYRLSSKGRTRLLKALVDYPINPGKYLLNDMEKEVFKIGSMLLESKFVLIMNEYNNHAEELVNAVESEEVDLTDDEKAELLKEGE